MNTEIEARLREIESEIMPGCDCCQRLPLVQALRRALEVADEYVPVDIMLGLETGIARILSASNDKEGE